MYNRFYKYLAEEKILHQKQVVFQTGHLTDHAIVTLVDQIHKFFEDGHHILDVFIDLLKSFGIADDSILLKKLEICGIKNSNFASFIAI